MQKEKDLIDRQAAIELFKDDIAAVNELNNLPSLPSAQPDVPDTNVGDTISRQAAIETVRKAQSIGQAHRMLLQLPSAQPERKKGHWIEVNDNYNRISGRCSVCGWESHMYEDDVVGMDFCPNCGARLDEKGGEVWSK